MWLQIPSDKVPFNQLPDMKAYEITEAGKEALRSGKYKMVRVPCWGAGGLVKPSSSWLVHGCGRAMHRAVLYCVVPPLALTSTRNLVVSCRCASTMPTPTWWATRVT